MSRAYRIRVQESLKRTIRAEDKVTSQLELLEVLPAEQMADLLREELKARGFHEQKGTLVREAGGVTTSVDPKTGEVTVEARTSEQIEIESSREGVAYDDLGPGSKNVRKTLEQQLQEALEKQAQHEQGKLQAKATQRLEGTLGELQRELNGVVNRVTAEALKQKAARLGQIKEVTEDPQTGSLTIKVEV